MYRNGIHALPSATALLILPLSGCQSSATDGQSGQQQTESHLPKTYAAATARLATLTKTILDACEDGDPDDAHGPLHEIGHVIKAAPALAEASDLSTDDVAAVQQACDELFAAFDRIDGSMHGRLSDGETLDYDELSQQVTLAMSVLSSKLDAASDVEVDVELEGDDHDHDHDHDDDVGDDE